MRTPNLVSIICFRVCFRFTGDLQVYWSQGQRLEFGSVAVQSGFLLLRSFAKQLSRGKFT